MTYMEIKALSGRELDAAVAVALGWTEVRVGDQYMRRAIGTPPDGVGRASLSYYATDWRDAGPLLEEMMPASETGLSIVRVDDGWEVQWCDRQAMDGGWDMQGAILPEAVSRAFVLYKSVESGDI